MEGQNPWSGYTNTSPHQRESQQREKVESRPEKIKKAKRSEKSEVDRSGRLERKGGPAE